MSRPWMPLYIADYLKDTTHLGALESGAYLHLIMNYWQNGKLPDDDKQLARIAKLTDREWKSAKATLQSFFHDGWKHKRIDSEIAHSIEVSGKRKAAAAARHAAKSQQDDSKSDANASANADTLHTSHKTERKKDAADAAPASDEVEFFRRGKAVLGATAGGLLRNLLKAKDNSIPLARSAVETASTKENPREYIGAIISKRDDSPESLRARGEAW